MPDSRYGKLQALVVDDFESFRGTLSRMLRELGVANVDLAANGAEALAYCKSRTYDIILCDQNLGKGKSGQQILEVLRYQPNPNSDSLFVLVSAETSKSIIMAAYDYEPDGYITKPITAQTLEQRLNRLLAQRMALAPIYKALKESDHARAIDLCRKEIASNSRYNNQCQKMLGRLLLESGRLEEAGALYHDILETRQLDWAMLGMAQVKGRAGDLLGAQQWLEEIIQFNPLCLKAYDLLADILQTRGDHQAKQKLLEQSVELSPLSILRQQTLGRVALKNNDAFTSANALRKAVKLGENSCHDNVEVHRDFVSAAIQLTDIDEELAKPFLRDALKAALELSQRFGKTADNKISSSLLEAQLQVALGDERKSKDAVINAKKIMATEADTLSLDTKIEWVKALRAQGNLVESEKMVAALLEEYADSEADLEKIDCLLEEPCSQKNKMLIAKINKEGIGFYESKNYLRATEAFKSALQELPHHVGLRLNLAQTLLEQLKLDRENQNVLIAAQQALQYAGKIIPVTHVQYRRYRQLDDVLRSYNEKSSQ